MIRRDASAKADALYADYLAQREAGAGVEFREWILEHPAEASELEALHAGWSQFESKLGAAFAHDHGQTEAPVHSSLVPGRRIGDYRLLRPMGSGGMGQVWAARQLTLERTVALKFIRPEKVTDSYVKLFAREARAAGRINHPGIVTVHEHGEAGGVHWIAMELVEGERTLADELQDARTQPAPTKAYFRETARRFVQIASAMQAAHEGGIVHRDVKPGNILMTRDGRPKVTDFGLARIAGESRMLESVEVVGSAYYMSPEQALGKRDEVDARSDVFSLGVVLYESLTFHKAFEGDSVIDVLRRIIREDPPEAHRVSRRVPEELSLICAHAMEKRSRDRFQTMGELAACLEAFLANEPLPISPPGPLARLRKWALRHPTASSVAALVSLSMVAIVGLLFAALAAERRAVERAEENAMLVREMRAQQLVADALHLGPIRRTNAGNFERWIAEVRALVERRPEYERELEQLRATGVRRLSDDEDLGLFALDQALAESAELLPGLEQNRGELEDLFAGRPVPEGLDTDRTIDDSTPDGVERRIAREAALVEKLGAQRAYRGQWQLANAEDQRRHDHLARLLDALVELGHPTVGLLPLVERKLALALDLGRSTLEEPAAEWDAVAAEVALDHGFVGLRPQLGLVPIGRDPATGLQEFWHVLSGARPGRDAGGALRLEDGSGIVLVLVPGGSFLMGAQTTDRGGPNFDAWADDYDKPAREVTLEPYFISKYEMTQGQWLRVTGANPSLRSAGRPYMFHGFVSERHPVEQVSWMDCRRVLAEIGLELPTEARWECAARAGGSSVFWTGDDFDTLASVSNFADRSFAQADRGIGHEAGYDDTYTFHAPVDAFQPNGFGLFCVSGNVDEWCLDSISASEPSLKAVRGGNFSHLRHDLGVARRRIWPMTRVFRNLGVRPARTVTLESP